MCFWCVCVYVCVQRLERCVGVVQSLTNGLSEREANDALTANVSYLHFHHYYQVEQEAKVKGHWLLCCRCAKVSSNTRRCVWASSRWSSQSPPRPRG